VLTPPDAVSMLLLLVPLYALFELALLAMYYTHLRQAKRQAAPPAEPQADQLG